MIGIGLVLTVGTGLFVASEFALVNVGRHDLEAGEARGEKRLGPTVKALKITSTHLSSAQFGIFIATVFSMVIGELVPKNFALALPLATAKIVFPFQTLFTTAFKPVILLFNNTANKIIRSFGIEPKEELSGARSAEELGSLVRRSALEGMLDLDHAVLLHRTLRFSDHTAADVMTPRVRMSTVNANDSAEEIVKLGTVTGFSRFPVIGRDRDEVLGKLHVKQALPLPRATATTRSLPHAWMNHS